MSPDWQTLTHPMRKQCGAGVWLQAPSGRVLVLETPDGRFELPGGKVEGGETPSEAARRELREETGLELPEMRAVVQLAPRYTVFVACVPREFTPRLSDEHVGFEWVGPYTARFLISLLRARASNPAAADEADLSWLLRPLNETRMGIGTERDVKLFPGRWPHPSCSRFGCTSTRTAATGSWPTSRRASQSQAYKS